MTTTASNGAAMVVVQDTAFRQALEPGSLESAYKIASMAAKIGIGGVKTPEDALIRIMHGRTLGISAAVALQFVFVINGRAGIDATLMRALCLAHPACEEFACLETTDKIATFRAKRKGQPATTLSWTIEQARAAKLDTKDVWRAYTAEMLRARATSSLARLVFPEAIAGLPAVEELRDGFADTNGNGGGHVDHDEMTGEVVPQHEVPAQAAPARDYEAEALAIKDKIASAKSKEERKAAREMIAKWDGGEPHGSELRAFYNLVIKADAPKPPPPAVMEPPPGASDAWEAP